MNLIFPISLAALADSINPCAFSVLLLSVTFLIGLGKSRHKIIKTGLVYILGIYLIYLSIGLGILRTLTIFGVPHVVAKIGAVILIIWGSLNLLEQFVPKFPVHLQIPKFIKPKLAGLIHQASLPAAFILGLLVGASEFPCTGGPYLFILGLLHDRSTFVSGLFYLLYYNVIFVAPLVGILIFSSDYRLHDRVKFWRKSHTKTIEVISSIILIAMGLAILYVR